MEVTKSGIVALPANEETVIGLAAGFRYWLHGPACSVGFGLGPNGDQRSTAATIAAAGWILEGWPCSYRSASIILTMGPSDGAAVLTCEPMIGFNLST